MPDKALEAYSRALAIDPTFEPSILGRGLALAALGRYDEALEHESPDFRVQAFLLSRVGRYREAAEVLDKGRREDDDAEVNANALLTSAWLLIEQKQYARALEEVRAAEKALADRTNHSLLVLADLIGGWPRFAPGTWRMRVSRLAAQKSRYDSDVPRRIELGRGARRRGRARARPATTRRCRASKRRRQKAWLTLGRDASTVFATNLPSRDGLARVEIARGNRAAAIEEYRRLTAVGPGQPVVRGARASPHPRAGASSGRRRRQGRRACRVRAVPEVVGECRRRPAGVDRSEASARVEVKQCLYLYEDASF